MRNYFAFCPFRKMPRFTRIGHVIISSRLAAFAVIIIGISHSAWAQEKPIAALGRMAVLGDITETQTVIIGNRVRGILSVQYDLISDTEYEQAEEAAFEALAAEECTEEACIRQIQEILQIERLFVLQIVRDAELTQLSFSLFKGDSRFSTEEICLECSVSELYLKVDLVVQRIVAEDQGAEIAALAPPEPEEPGGRSTWPAWAGGGLLLLGAVYIDAALTLSAESEKLGSQSRKENDTAKFKKSEAKADDAATQGTIGLVAVLAGASLITYYLMGDDDATAFRGDADPMRIAARAPFAIEIHQNQVSVAWRMRW